MGLCEGTARTVLVGKLKVLQIETANGCVSGLGDRDRDRDPIMGYHEGAGCIVKRTL